MARDKRSAAQLAFDMAKHGWAFCNKQMLGAKLIQLSALADNLSKADPRWSVLRLIREHYNDM